MQGAREFSDLFETGQHGRLYMVSSQHARGRTFRIYVLPEGEEAIANGRHNPPLNENAVEVYGICGGHPGWTEWYGWKHEGPWQDDFTALCEIQHAKKTNDKIVYDQARQEATLGKYRREAALLADYKRVSCLLKISFDFDGVLHESMVASDRSAKPLDFTTSDLSPRHEYLDLLKEEIADGHDVAIVTARDECHRDVIRTFLDRHGVPDVPIYFTSRSHLKASFLMETHKPDLHIDDDRRMAVWLDGKVMLLLVTRPWVSEENDLQIVAATWKADFPAMSKKTEK